MDRLKPKPLTEAQKAAYKQHVKDKTLPLRIRFFAEWSLKILFCLGIVALVGYGGVYLWSLVYVKDRAAGFEQKIQEKIKETQRDAEE